MLADALPTLHIDPELQAYIDPLTAEELAALEASLVAEGCRDALVVWDDVLIDGHNRYAICHRLGIPFRIEQRSFASVDDVHLWMIDNQLARRNLTEYQRTALALKKKGIIAARAKANQAHGQTAPGKTLLTNSSKASTNTRKEIAVMAGVGEDTVAKVEKIEANAVPAIRAAASAGALSINAAAKLAKLPRAQQEAIAAGGTKATQDAAKAAPAQPKQAAPVVEAVAPAAPAAAAPAADGELAALRAENARLRAENDELKAELAEQAVLMEGLNDESQVWLKIIAGDDALAAARAEIKKLQELVRVMDSQYNGVLHEKNEYLRLSKKHKALADKLEKRLKKVEQGGAAHAA